MISSGYQPPSAKVATQPLGRTHHGPDRGRIRHHRIVADQHRGRRQPAHPGQGGSQQHDLPRLPSPAGCGVVRRRRLLGRRGAAGGRGGAEACRGVPASRYRRGRPVPRCVRPGARGVLAALAATPRHPAKSSRAHERAADVAGRAVGPVRGDAGRCARCCPPRGQALVAGAADPPEGERRPRSGHRLLRARVGHLPGAGVRLRRGAPAGAGGRRRPRPGPDRSTRAQVGQQPHALGQHPPSAGRPPAHSGRRMARAV